MKFEQIFWEYVIESVVRFNKELLTVYDLSYILIDFQAVINNMTEIIYDSMAEKLQIAETKNYDLIDIIEKKEYEDKYSKKIPVIVAGGIFDKQDIIHAIKLGADGVQIASRFVATKECDASPAYKQAYINARQEDVQIIQSPVGMPGRALRNAFIKQLDNSRIPISKCYNCLEKCNPAKVPYCITKALINAVKGDVDNGLIFCGANVGRINEITTVHSLMKELTE